MPRSVVCGREFDRGEDRPPGTRLQDSIIDELHVKGLTKLHPHVPERLRGTYAGLAEPAVIDHLTRLGVTAVELLPVHQFVHDGALVAWGLRNYRGYQSIDFFAPHNEYSSSGERGGLVDEFKAMVKSLHTTGLEMILDEVFNHTAEETNGGRRCASTGLTTAPTTF